MSAKLPTINDNQGGATVLAALQKILPQAKRLDVATGTFEVSGFMSLDGQWQALDHSRVLMGDETTKRTKKELVLSLRRMSDDSIEISKEQDDDLTPLKAVQEALVANTIEVRVYAKAKFHAKLYLTEMPETSLVDFAMVGSSNFTASGLTRNLELNLLTTDQLHIEKLREWYEAVWEIGEPVNDELLQVIEPHVTCYDPFTIYARALQEYFSGREKTEDAWEANESIIYKLLSKYQRDGYRRAVQIARRRSGVLFCDGVGLGKTFVGLMVLERCIRDGKRVLLIVPKSAKESVWMANINRYLAPKYRRFFKELFDIQLHTDFGREGTISPEDLEYFKEHKDVVIIDEAHHWRNPKSNRGQVLSDLARGKDLYMLTATPINNSLDDLYHLINYFTGGDPAHFLDLRINDLRKHFIEAEKRIEGSHKDMPLEEAVDVEDFLRTDVLLREVLIQRSRKYVKESEAIAAGAKAPLFPERQMPRVVNYSLKSVYASLYAELKDAFDKANPFLTLAIYNTTRYHKDPDKRTAQQQVQVIGLIRTLLLKRLESSYKAFEASVEDLLYKMIRFLLEHDKEQYEAWMKTNTRWWAIVQQHITHRIERELEEEDDLPPVIQDFDPKQHDIGKLLRDIVGDMELLTGFLSKLYRRFYHEDQEGEIEDPTKDDKLQKLIKLLREDDLLKDRKVLIFSEFRDTARYLDRQLQAAGFKNVEEVDSSSKKNRETVIHRFAPYYNLFHDKPKMYQALDNPIDILISTDVLSEGLNLQDASLIINYDLHWNPVRLMQRIGRVDRRLNDEIEEAIERPDDLNMKVHFWNFLPPDELEDILNLKKRLDGKIVRINKTLGIEGAILSPDDPDMSMKLFNERYEGKETTEELMHLERERIEFQDPELWAKLPDLPRRLFSGRAISEGYTPFLNREGKDVADVVPPSRPGVFACYRMPSVIAEGATELFDMKDEAYDPEKHPPGPVRWYFYDSETNKVVEDLRVAWAHSRCTIDTPRETPQGQVGLRPALKAIEKQIKNTYLRDAQIPVGSKPILVAWLEISP